MSAANYDISRFFDKEGCLKIWPSKKEMQNKVLEYISGQFENKIIYTEKEVNSRLKTLSASVDYALLRRELYNNNFFDREKDGSKYWLKKPNSHY